MVDYRNNTNLHNRLDTADFVSGTKRRRVVKTSVSYADRIIFLLLGGFFLASAVERCGLHKRFALYMLKIFGSRPKYVTGAFIIITGSLSAWMSNTATTASMIPIAASLAHVMDINPILLMMPIVVGASFGFILPSSTPPNAIAVSSGLVKTKTMAKIGLPLNVITIISTAVLTTLLVPPMWEY